MTMAADTVEDVLAGRPAHFSWRALAKASRPIRGSCAASSRSSRCSTTALSNRAAPPARRSRTAATQLDLAGTYQARVRLTGLVPMNDDQFAT